MNVAPRSAPADPYAALPIPRHGREEMAPPEGLDLGRLFAILRRKMWLILLCAAAAVVVAGVILANMTPLYTATAQLKLDQQEQINRSFRDLVTEFDIDSNAVAGEIAIMESSGLLARVAERLELAGTPEFNPALRETSPFGEAVGRARSWARALVAPERPAAPPGDATPEAAGQTRGSGPVVGVLRNRVQARQLGNAYIVEVSATSEDPARAAAIANALVDSYLEEQLGNKFATMRRVSNWLSSRMGDMRTRLEDSEAAVQDFLGRQIGADGETTTLLEQQISEMTTTLVAARSEHAEAMARREILRRFVEERGAGAAAAILASPILDANRQRLLQLRSEEAQILARFGEDSGKLDPLRREIEALRAENALEVERVVAGAEDAVSVAAAKIDLLDTELRDLRRRALDLGRRQVELRQLEREAEANQAIYEKFLATFKESRELLELQTADARVISYAEVPAGPSSPQLKVSLALALAAGASAGIALALVLELLRRGFGSARELSERTGLPVLGTFARRGRFPAGDPVERALRDPRAPAAEEARALRGFVQMAGPTAPRIICFASSLPGEGHADVAILTALSFAQMGRSSVLVDADLRGRPIAARLGASGLPDIVAVLRGEAAAEDAIAVSDRTGLCYLPAETAVADPSALLLSGAMTALLERLGETFDIVVLNAPPLLATTDGLALIDRADLVLVAVRRLRTPASALGEALDRLKRVGARTIGLVMTGVDRAEEARSRSAG